MGFFFFFFFLYLVFIKKQQYLGGGVVDFFFFFYCSSVISYFPLLKPSLSFFAVLFPPLEKQPPPLFLKKDLSPQKDPKIIYITYQFQIIHNIYNKTHKA